MASPLKNPGGFFFIDAPGAIYLYNLTAKEFLAA